MIVGFSWQRRITSSGFALLRQQDRKVLDTAQSVDTLIVVMNRIAALLLTLFTSIAATSAQTPQAHSVILFVPDGLRALSVTPDSAPTMAALRDKGVNFKNSHSLFPTFTTANASAMATGHYLGDTGNYGNTIYVAHPIESAEGSVMPAVTNSRIRRELDQHFRGDYLNQQTVLKAARGRGFSTAVIGKNEPASLFDHTEWSGELTILFDDATGSPSGIPLSEEVKTALRAAGLPLTTPPRGENGKAGDFKTPGTRVANIQQQKYFVDVASKIVLPMFKARNKPFLLVYWSSDPDRTQHAQGDSLNTLTPGINGPTSRAGIKNADDNLKQLCQTLEELDLVATTDIIIAADHGFATLSKESATSFSAKLSYADVPPGFLPRGFLAIDLAKALDLPLFDPDNKNVPVAANAAPRFGSGLIGQNPTEPDVVIASNGGSDLVYLPSSNRNLAARVIRVLLAQDYVSGLFVDDALGRFPGTLPLSSVNLKGTAVTPQPSIVVSFRSFTTGCDEPTMCSVIVADTGYQQGQGMHGSFSRAETWNFMAAIGPDFKSGFIDEAPVSNADVGRTVAAILGLKIPDNGKLVGRVFVEAMPQGKTPSVIRRTLSSAPSATGLRTVVVYQQVGATRYFDVAGFPGRTVGLKNRDYH
jgi:hypothetical protein